MSKFYFGENGEGKLVRDKLDGIIRSQGHKVVVKKLDRINLEKAILNKMPEEIREIGEAIDIGNRDEIVEELADLQSLINSLREVLEISESEVIETEAMKSAKKGAFVEGVFIESVELNSDSDNYAFWLKHFRDNSDRYKESE